MIMASQLASTGHQCEADLEFYVMITQSRATRKRGGEMFLKTETVVSSLECRRGFHRNQILCDRRGDPIAATLVAVVMQPHGLSAPTACSWSSTGARKEW